MPNILEAASSSELFAVELRPRTTDGVDIVALASDGRELGTSFVSNLAFAPSLAQEMHVALTPFELVNDVYRALVV